MEHFARLVHALHAAQVRYLVIGVWGANYYARSGGMVFVTKDVDLFLPLDAGNLLRAWESSTAAGLSLWVGNEPLDSPRDLQLARAVVERRAGVAAVDTKGRQIDLTLVMAGFEFEDVWSRRRSFAVEGVEVPVASLADIVQSKARVGRPKDRLFLATHEEAINQLLHGHDWRSGPDVPGALP